MRRLLGVLIAFIALWMGLVGPSPAVATPTLSNSAHTYDTSHHTAQADHVVSSRAPPRKLFEAPTQSAEPGSRGAQARPSAAARYSSTNYDAPTSLAQSDNRTGTTTVSGSTIDAGLLSFQTTGVAANAAPKALAASTRAAPWAGSTLSRLSREGEVMYRVYGGGAAKAGSWLTPINPASSAAARQGLGLPAENAALYVSRVTLPGGVRMQVGTAGEAFGQPGGWAQAQLLERIPLSSFGKGVPLP